MSYLTGSADIIFDVIPGVGAGEGDSALTGPQILALLEPVDGASSLLDADMVDGQHASAFATLAALDAEAVARALADSLLAPINDAVLTGNPEAPTQAPGTNNNTIATMAALAAALGGGPGASGFPVLFPEQYGITENELDADVADVVAAWNAMFADALTAGGAFIYCKGNYPIDEPLVAPAVPLAIVGVARGDNDESRSCIRGIAGDHDLLKFPYGAKSVYMANMTFAHTEGVVPTDGVAIDARWLSDSRFCNNATWNLHNGVDMGVGRSMIVDGLFMRGFTGRTSGIGTDAYGDDRGFGILIRSNQVLLDGNVGDEATVYDRDGPGVTVQPKSKGTSVRLSKIFISGKVIGDDDEESLTEEYAEGFVALDIMGASTVRVESAQLRQSENAIRMRHAPNLDGSGDETGKQMCAGNFFINISAEACKQTYQIHGHEKFYAIHMQANGVATRAFDIGDNPNTGSSVTATTSSARTKYNGVGQGPYIVRNNGAAAVWVRSGDSTITAATSGPSTQVAAGAAVKITRAAGDTHLAYIAASGSQAITLGGIPGVEYGVSPVDQWGGTGTFFMCNALTCREEGFLVRSGINRFIEPMVAGYSGNRLGDVDPGSSASFTATTSSARVEYNTDATGTFVVQNRGSSNIWVLSGNSSVVATTSGPSVEVVAGSYVNITRAPGDTHLAYISVSGSQDGRVGRPATLLSVGFDINSAAVNGTWINGGVISSNKSLKAVGNVTNQGSSLRIQNGANKVFIDGLDLAEGGFAEKITDNAAATTTDIQIQNLKRSGYTRSSYPLVQINTQVGTSYTPTLADNGRTVTLANAAAIGVSLPSNATTALPIGFWVEFANIGAGTATASAGSGATMVASSAAMTTGQCGRALKTGTNAWLFTKR